MAVTTSLAIISNNSVYTGITGIIGINGNMADTADTGINSMAAIITVS